MSRMRAQATAGAADRSTQGGTGLNPMIEAKLWRNPCWFAFRFNYIALRYNGPLYGWVEQTYGLTRPEFVVIYSLGLRDGSLARDISASAGFPKNTLSRAIHKLARLKLISREKDPNDGRNQVLRLTKRGWEIFNESLPYFEKFEHRMLETLTGEERDTLSRLLAKIVLDSVSWPDTAEVVLEDTVAHLPSSSVAANRKRR